MIGVGIVAAALQAPWTPARLFTNGEAGAWYYIRPEYLRQNSNGTGAVTADGDPVGYVEDRSGNGHNLTQATAAKRPLYKTSGGLHWLDFDGVDDALASAAIDLSATDEIDIFAGLQRDQDAAAAMAVEFSADFNTNAGSFYVTAPDSSSVRWATISRGDAAANVNQLASTTAGTAPQIAVVTGLHDISLDSSKLRIDGTQVATATGNKGLGNFGNHPLYVGARGGSSVFFDGRVYGLIVRGATSGAGEISNAENWVARKAGVTL